MWFTNNGNNSIGRITTSGVISNYTAPSIDAPDGITAGPDGALWFTNLGNNSIGRITTGRPEKQAIISQNRVVATVGSGFTFTVSTSGASVSSLSEMGRLPRGVAFVNRGGGTATISGTPVAAGVSHLTIKATFATGKKKVLTQAFTLTVNPA